jgi:RNA polymerase sigma factor (sigma-70 family)
MELPGSSSCPAPFVVDALHAKPFRSQGCHYSMSGTEVGAVGASRRFADMDGGSIEDLYRGHSSAAFRLPILLVGNSARAEDLVHEAFVRLLSRFRSIQDPQALRAYLNRTIVNLAKNHHRDEGRRRRVLASQPTSDVEGMPDVAQRDEIHRQLKELPYRQRAALVLRYCEDLSEKEVADALNTSPKAVRSLVGRGLAALRSKGIQDE